jgi:peptide/nickel transport system permease protein
MFSQRLPVTLELGLLALALAIIFSVLVAVLAASRANGVVDKLSVTLSMIGLSVPNFVIGLLFIFLFAVHLRLVPSSGFVPLSTSIWLNLKSMILPASTIAFGLFASFTRILRGDLVDQLVGSDYIMFARSKGLSPKRILLSHALRNSMFGYLTIVALNLGTLLGGAVLVEQIFALPGIGQELVQSITYHDSTVVESVVVILSVTVVVANLLTDLLYSVLDPRIRDGRRA